MTDFFEEYLLFDVGVASHKFFDASCGVNDFLLSGVEGVAECADFDFDYIVINSVDASRFVAFHG